MRHARPGKWIVAQTDSQHEALLGIERHAAALDIAVHFLSRKEALQREPAVRAAAGVLESPSTGILDSHGLMTALLGQFEEAGGTVALMSAVKHVQPKNRGHGGWEVTIKAVTDERKSTYDRSRCPDNNFDTSKPEESVTITTDTLINAAGLEAVNISNGILPSERHIKPYYAKGTYYAYSAPHPRPRVLVYPAPKFGAAGLGTHLTLDLSGTVRFGPDVEWVDKPSEVAPEATGCKLKLALEEVQSYLPGIDKSAVSVDYAGIRPKLHQDAGAVQGQAFQDFYIKKEPGFEGFINLLGIESPGLTSALAIADMVEELLYS